MLTSNSSPPTMLSVSVFPQAVVKDQRQNLTIPPEKEEVGRGARTEEVEPKVVLLRVVGVDAPPVVDEDVGDRKEQNEERGRVLGLETNDDPTETNERRHRVNLSVRDGGTWGVRRRVGTNMMQAPRPTRETSTRAKDHWPWKTKPMKRKMRRTRPASWKLFGAKGQTRSALTRRRLQSFRRKGEDVLLLPVGLADARKSSPELLLGAQVLTEDHEESSNDREVPQEERQVKDEAVTEGLADDDSEETSDRLGGVLALDDENRAGDHGLLSVSEAGEQS